MIAWLALAVALVDLAILVAAGVVVRVAMVKVRPLLQMFAPPAPNSSRGWVGAPPPSSSVEPRE